jgi:hypothetical protein
MKTSTITTACAAIRCWPPSSAKPTRPEPTARAAADRGKPLAGKSTLHRLELTPADATAAERYTHPGQRTRMPADPLAAHGIRRGLWSLA